jgi:hypothetical protein
MAGKVVDQAEEVLEDPGVAVEVDVRSFRPFDPDDERGASGRHESFQGVDPGDPTARLVLTDGGGRGAAAPSQFPLAHPRVPPGLGEQFGELHDGSIASVLSTPITRSTGAWRSGVGKNIG